MLRAWHSRASACSVLPRPMSSARMPPPSPVVMQRGQPAEALLLVRAQLGVHLGGHRLTEEHTRLTQRGHRTLPIRRLTGQLAQLVVPDAGLNRPTRSTPGGLSVSARDSAIRSRSCWNPGRSRPK